MHFHAKEIYYIAIIVDLTLRCTWSLKLSPHLDHFNDLEGGIFAMEFLEVFRRFIWIFFRVETEWSKYKFCDYPLASSLCLGFFLEGLSKCMNANFRGSSLE